MHAFRHGAGRRILAAFTLWLLIAAPVGAVMAQDEPDDWNPQSNFEGKFDWIQMKSGEWVKGEILVMYDADLEFDSAEFDDLVLSWDDIQYIHSAQVMNVGLLGKRSAVGILIVDGDKVTVVGDDGPQEFTKGEVLTITAGEPKEINYWNMKVFFGLIVRSGNSDIREASMQGAFKRRTIHDRIVVDFVGNKNVTEDIEVSDNLRASAAWDKFINDRFFVKPVFVEYFRDPFQNIRNRITVGAGAGYQLIDSPKIDWSVSGGPAYQQTRFDDVVPGESEEESTPAFVVGTNANWDITKWMEFDGTYRFQIVNEESGTYNHHVLISFETEITKWIDFDISWVWDRIKNPREDSDGTLPKQDDIRMTVGLTFDF